MTVDIPVRLQRAKDALVKRLMDEPGFVGAGISMSATGEYEIVVMVVETTSPALAKVPQRWQGIPVRAQIGGVPRKF